jgi:protein O-GlcNAc transferase
MRPFVLLLTLAVAHAEERPSIEKAMQLVSTGKLAEAESMLLDLEKADPRNPEVEYRFGLVLLKEGKLDDARLRLESAAKLDPKYPFVWSALGLLHETLAKAAARNDAPTAAKEFQEAIRLDPSRPVYYLELAQLFLDHDTAEPAELVLKNAVRRFPTNAEVLRLLGLADYAQGKSQEALDAFLKAIDADPDAESAYASLEVLLPDAQRRLPDVIAKLQKFSERHKESPIGPFLLALIDPGKSEPLLRQAIRVAPGFWPAYFELHKLLKAREQWDEAAAALKKTAELNPDYAPAHYALAEYYNRKGDRARAATERELHHKLLADQRKAAEQHRSQAPRLSFTVGQVPDVPDLPSRPKAGQPDPGH